MKKLFILIMALCLFAFVSCSDPIFYNISQEIALSDPTVTANVVNVTKLGDKLYCANGNINIKGTARWTKTSKPASKIVMVAADTTYLYAYDDNKNVWAKSASTDWKKVDSDATLFFDNDSTTNPAVYYKKSNELYKLNGETSAKVDIASAKTIDTTDSSKIKGCVNVAGIDYFSTSPAMTTKDNVIYFGSSSAIKSVKADNLSNITIAKNVENEVTVLCITDSTLYIGTIGGLKSATINADGSISDPQQMIIDNVSSTFGSRTIHGIWYIDSKLYVSSGSFTTDEYDFLWSYNNSTKKWDKE